MARFDWLAQSGIHYRQSGTNLKVHGHCRNMAWATPLIGSVKPWTAALCNFQSFLQCAASVILGSF